MNEAVIITLSLGMIFMAYIMRKSNSEDWIRFEKQMDEIEKRIDELKGETK